MNPTLRRLEAMDAQRFDLSKRRNPSNRVISTVAPSVPCEEPGIPQITILSSESPSDEISPPNESSSATDHSTSSSDTVIEATIFTHKNDVEATDVFERDGYTTTRTIIRPQSPGSSTFSRPSTPVPGVFSRPSSPLGIRLADLNCMGSTDAFEEQVDVIVQRREKDLAGATQEIQVKVTQDQAVFYQHKWKDAIQSILSEHTPPLVSCVGHLHSY